MQRYLLRIAFDGRHFKGLQKVSGRQALRAQTQLDQWHERHGSVQSSLEHMLTLCLRPRNEVIVQTASRTDAGVSGDDVAVTVDLMRSDNQFFSPLLITAKTNEAFEMARVPIRILKTSAVRGDFVVQKQAVARTYVYYLATLRDDVDIALPKASRHTFTNLPVFGRHRRIRRVLRSAENHVLMGSRGFSEYRVVLDEKLFESALKRFEGSHNFRYFTTKKALEKRREEDLRREKDRDTAVRVVHKIDLQSFQPQPQFANDDEYRFLKVTIKGQSYLYNQVRRMIGAALDVGCHRLQLEELERLLNGDPLDFENDRDKFIGSKVLTLAKAEGLRLHYVHLEPLEDQDLMEDLEPPVLPEPNFTPLIIDWPSVNLLPIKHCSAFESVMEEQQLSSASVLFSLRFYWRRKMHQIAKLRRTFIIWVRKRI